MEGSCKASVVFWEISVISGSRDLKAMMAEGVGFGDCW